MIMHSQRNLAINRARDIRKIYRFYKLYINNYTYINLAVNARIKRRVCAGIEAGRPNIRGEMRSPNLHPNYCLLR